MRIVVPNPSLVILCGPAGSGKSSFARRHFPENAVVSSDRCRAMIADDEANLRVSGHAFALFHQIIDSRLRFRRLTVADSTAVRSDARAALRRLGRRWKLPVMLIAFDVPEETAIQWDGRRGRGVGSAVIHRQWMQFQEALRGISAEGYDHMVRLGEDDVTHAQVALSSSSGR